MISIEPLTQEYIQELYLLEKASFSEPWSEITFIKELENPQAHYLVAIKNGILVGYAGMWVILEEGHITNIAVAKDHRGCGIGKMLVGQLIKKAYQMDLVGLTLEVRESNIAAISLYESFGFVSVGERKNYYLELFCRRLTDFVNRLLLCAQHGRNLMGESP